MCCVQVRVLPSDELVYDIEYEDGEKDSGLPEKYVKPNTKAAAGAYLWRGDPRRSLSCRAGTERVFCGLTTVPRGLLSACVSLHGTR